MWDLILWVSQIIRDKVSLTTVSSICIVYIVYVYLRVVFVNPFIPKKFQRILIISIGAPCRLIVIQQDYSHIVHVLLMTY